MHWKNQKIHVTCLYCSIDFVLVQNQTQTISEMCLFLKITAKRLNTQEQGSQFNQCVRLSEVGSFWILTAGRGGELLSSEPEVDSRGRRGERSSAAPRGVGFDCAQSSERCLWDARINRGLHWDPFVQKTDSFASNPVKSWKRPSGCWRHALSLYRWGRWGAEHKAICSKAMESVAAETEQEARSYFHSFDTFIDYLQLSVNCAGILISQVSLMSVEIFLRSSVVFLNVCVHLLLSCFRLSATS